jgi:hypothetical protein
MEMNVQGAELSFHVWESREAMVAASFNTTVVVNEFNARLWQILSEKGLALSNEGKPLALRGRIIRIDEGSRVLRYLLAGAVGQAEIEAEGELLFGEKILATFFIKKNASGAFHILGGDCEGLLMNCARQAAAEIAKQVVKGITQSDPDAIQASSSTEKNAHQRSPHLWSAIAEARIKEGTLPDDLLPEIMRDGYSREEAEHIAHGIVRRGNNRSWTMIGCSTLLLSCGILATISSILRPTHTVSRGGEEYIYFVWLGAILCGITGLVYGIKSFQQKQKGKNAPRPDNAFSSQPSKATAAPIPISANSAVSAPVAPIPAPDAVAKPETLVSKPAPATVAFTPPSYIPSPLPSLSVPAPSEESPRQAPVPVAVAKPETPVSKPAPATAAFSPTPYTKASTDSTAKVLIIGAIIAIASVMIVCSCLLIVPVAMAFLAPATTSTPHMQVIQPFIETRKLPPVGVTKPPTEPEWFITAMKESPTAEATFLTAAPLPTATPSIHIHALSKTILDISGSHLLWSPDGKWLIIGERQIHFFDAKSLKEVRSIQADRWVEGLAISPDSKVLAAIDESRGVMLFDMASGSELRTLPRTQISTSAVSNSFLAFSPDSSSLGVIIGDVVKIFNVAGGQETGTIVATVAENIELPPNSIAISPDGKQLYAAGWGGLGVWDIASSNRLFTIGDIGNSFNRMALSPDGKLLATAATSNQPIILWEATTGRQLRTLTGHSDGVTSLAFSANGRMLVSASRDVTISLWDVASGSPLQSLVGHSEPAVSIAISPDGATLASGSQDGTTRLWTITYQ